MYKRFIMTWVAIPLSAVLILAGCGQTGKAGEGLTGSGAAVKAYQDEEKKEKDFWAKVDRELYCDYTEKTGPQGQKYVTVYNTKYWIYYIVGDEEKEEENKLCRAPVKNGGGDDTILFEKEEMIAQMSLIFDVYASDSYVIFSGGDGEGTSECYKFDLSTKKCTVLGEGKEFRECDLVVASNGTPIILDNELFVITEYGVYALDPEKEKLYQIGEKNYSVCMVKCGDSIYFTSDHQKIYRYDGGEKKAVCVLDKDTIREKLNGLKLWGENGRCTDFGFEDIYSYQNRLYMDVSANWEKQKQGKKQTKYTTNGILLSAAVDDIGNIKHENGLFDSLFTIDEKGNETGREGKNIVTESDVSDEADVRNRVSTVAGISGIVDGKVVLYGLELRSPTVSSISYLPCLAYDLATDKITINPNVEFVDLNMKDWKGKGYIYKTAAELLKKK